MPQPRVAPFGSWKSPITSDLIVSGTIGLDQVVLDGEDIYWIEARPAEAGRNVMVRRTPDGRTTDLTPPPFNARTRVHEYGGGAFTVRDGIAYFANYADQRLYGQEARGQPRPITPEGDLRYADAVVDPRGRILCVREDHTAGGKEPRNTLVSIPLDGSAARVLVSGNDFYSTPRLSPDGTRLAWLTWNHPNMPWDGTELWVGEMSADGTLGPSVRVAGGPTESIFQPAWSPDGVLHFVSDRTGWWNLYRQSGATAEALCSKEAEFGRPQWVFGLSTYAFEPSGGIVCTYSENDISCLARLDPRTRTCHPIDTSYTEISYLRTAGNRLVFVGGSPTEATAVVLLNLSTLETQVLRRSSDIGVDPGYLSVPQAIEFPTENGLTAHAFYYPPQNRDFTGPPGDRPPLVVRSHGGPTAATTAQLRLEYHYWTSRGIALVDVNYGGSTGYGRAYRERLSGQWGIVDRDDCANAARYLVERGLADPQRLAIRGGSAGGYTTLCALTFRGDFRAGASYYGVSDLEALARDTHKFESRYLDKLVGPYPQRRELYRERSPIHFTDRLSCPVILFQGLEDKVVPPSQAEIMVEALRRKGLPVAYIPFEGEQHGFRRAENIKRALDAELYFYGRIFGFELADPVPPVAVENLPA
jgi:dipeptidyl aminopeptidase/acylaminoacyl peptidase